MVGTLYMDGEPVEIHRQSKSDDEGQNSHIQDYIPESQLEMRPALKNRKYQVHAIKVGDILICDQVLIKRISWNDLVFQGVCHLTNQISRPNEGGFFDIPKPLWEKIGADEREAFEISVTEVDGRNGFFLTPYSPIEKSALRKLNPAMLNLCRERLPGQKLVLVGQTGVLSCMQYTDDGWCMDECKWPQSETKWVYDDAVSGHGCYREIGGEDVWAFPVKYQGVALYALAITGKNVSGAERSLIQTSAKILESML